jgi:rhamnosyl/mannosyltransferase
VSASGSRVLHVAHHCLPHVGGLETVVAAETRGLVARGWDVTVLSSAHTVGAGVREECGVRTVRVRAWNGLATRLGVPFPVFSPWLLVACGREVRRAGLVHVHDPLYLSSWVAALWCLVLGRPYVVHRHVGFVHHSSALVRLVQRVVLGTVGRLVLERARAVLPIDDHVAASTRASVRGAARVVVLGNGVDTRRFRPASAEERRRARAELGLPADRPLVLFVARFVPKKGFAAVAAAASDAYDLVFAGDERPPGYDDPRLHFVGSVPTDVVPRVYHAADAMVVASVGECPLTVLEALSSGLPVVANDDPALHTPWTAGPGVVFADIAAGRLRSVLERLVDDLPAARRTTVEGADHVRTAFSWEAHVDRLEAVYRAVLDQTGGAAA